MGKLQLWLQQKKTFFLALGGVAISVGAYAAGDMTLTAAALTAFGFLTTMAYKAGNNRQEDVLKQLGRVFDKLKSDS